MSTETTPATRLRQAAEKLRKLGSEATEGPWWSDQSPDCYRLHGVAFRIPADDLIPEQVVNKQILKAPKRGTPYAEYWPQAVDDAWITTMNPRLAEPLAAWLDVMARVAEFAETRGYPTADQTRAALSVADALLSEPTEESE